MLTDLRRLQRALTHLSAIALIVLIPVVACEQYDKWWYRRFVPIKIDVDAMIFSRRDTNDRSDCGAVVFRLPQTAADAIEREGLAFFDGEDARRPTWTRSTALLHRLARNAVSERTGTKD